MGFLTGRCTPLWSFMMKLCFIGRNNTYLCPHPSPPPLTQGRESPHFLFPVATTPIANSSSVVASAPIAIPLPQSTTNSSQIFPPPVAGGGLGWGHPHRDDELLRDSSLPSRHRIGVVERDQVHLREILKNDRRGLIRRKFLIDAGQATLFRCTGRPGVIAQ
jgi:hypothetical protein